MWLKTVESEIQVDVLRMLCGRRWFQFSEINPVGCLGSCWVCLFFFFFKYVSLDHKSLRYPLQIISEILKNIKKEIKIVHIHCIGFLGCLIKEQKS